MVWGQTGKDKAQLSDIKPPVGRKKMRRLSAQEERLPNEALQPHRDGCRNKSGNEEET